MNIKVLTVSDNMDATAPLLKSLDKNKWDYHVIDTPFRGFGTKLIATYQYLKNHPEITEFIFCDAFDVICLGGEAEFREKLISTYPYADVVLSAERGLWPGTLEQFRGHYTKCQHRFDYANSGCYYATSEMFIALIEHNMPEFAHDDQEWFNLRFLSQQTAFIFLDNDQALFNSHSFIDDGEYGYENGRIQINGNEPLFIHKNGRTVDPKLDEMLNNLK